MRASIKYLICLTVVVVLAKLMAPRPQSRYQEQVPIRNIASDSFEQEEDLLRTQNAYIESDIEVPLPPSDEVIADQDMASKIAALIEKRRMEDKELKDAETTSIKDAIEEHKKMKKLQAAYEKLEQELNQFEEPSFEDFQDPLFAAFGTPVKTITIAQNESVSANGNGASPNSSNAEATSSKIIEIKTWKNKNYFMYGEEPIELYATIKSDSPSLPSTIEGEVYAANQEMIATITYNREENNLYRANFQPKLKDNAHFGNFHIKLKININSQQIKMIETFSLSTRKVTFRNRISYELTEEKNLRFKSLFRIAQDGTYLFQGTLYDSNDKLIGVAEIPLELRRGNSWINLDFHGNTMFAKKLSGPFTLKNMAVYQVNDDLSSHTQEMIPINHITEDHSWTEFNPNSEIDSLIHGKIVDLENALAL